MYQAIVIDDEKWVVKSLIATIKNQDYFEITTEFYDGLSGLEYIRIHQPALAFVDVRLPGMGGLEILQAAHAEGLSTLFIMISGHAEFAYAQKAMFHNAIGYCLKPFSRSELMDSMQKAYQLLQEQEQKADISIQNLAEYCSINPNYASQIFRQETGGTFVSYLTSLRIEHAAWLLAHSDQTVFAIATQVGYSDYFYFAKVFKKVKGCTPTAYRKDSEEHV